MSLPANTKYGNMKVVMKNRKIRYKIDMGLYMRIFLPPPPSSNIKIARLSRFSLQGASPSTHQNDEASQRQRRHG
jgi:hypothetical protein